MVMISTVDHFRIRKTVNPTDHSLCDQLPVGLLAQLIKQCTADLYRRHSLSSRVFEKLNDSIICMSSTLEKKIYQKLGREVHGIPGSPWLRPKIGQASARF